MTSPLLTGARNFAMQQVQAAGGLYPLTLTKANGATPAFDPDNPLEPRNAQKSSYPTQGLVNTTLAKINGTLINEGEALILVIGGFLPDGVNPEAGDEIVSGSDCYEVLEIEGNSTQATFRCRVKKK